MIQVCVNNNNNNAGGSAQYSCYEPSQATPTKPKRDFRFQVIEVKNEPKWFVWPSKNRGSAEEIDENHNKGQKEQPKFLISSTQNGYGAIRRSVIRTSKRGKTEQELNSRTASEPAGRRLSTKKEKATTEPIPAPTTLSNTFKILSVDKKWESFDATDDEDEIIESVSTDGGRRWTTSV